MYLMTRPIAAAALKSRATSLRGLGCADCGGTCGGAGLGDFSFSSFLAGSAWPLLLVGGLAVLFLFRGPGAQRRRSALSTAKAKHAAAITDENTRYRNEVAEIKRSMRRTDIPVRVS